MSDSFNVLFIDSNPAYCNAALTALNSVGVTVDSYVSFHNALRHVVKNGSRSTMCFVGIDQDSNTILKTKINLIRSCIAMHIPYLITFQNGNDLVKLASFSNEWKNSKKMMDGLVDFNLSGKKSDASFWYKVWDYLIIGHGATYDDSRCVVKNRYFFFDQWNLVMDEKRKNSWSPFNIEQMKSWQVWRKDYKKSFGKEVHCEKAEDIA